MKDSKWKGKYNLAVVSDLAWGWRWVQGWGSCGSCGIFRSPCSGEEVCRNNQDLASCATGEIAQFSSFSTNMEDQEKQRNLTDKNQHRVNLLWFPVLKKKQLVLQGRITNTVVLTGLFYSEVCIQNESDSFFVNSNYLANVCPLVSQDSFNWNNLSLWKKGGLVSLSHLSSPLPLLFFGACLWKVEAEIN